ALRPEGQRGSVVVLLERVDGRARRVALDALRFQVLDDVALAEATLALARGGAGEARVRKPAVRLEFVEERLDHGRIVGTSRELARKLGARVIASRERGERTLPQRREFGPGRRRRTLACGPRETRGTIRRRYPLRCRSRAWPALRWSRRPRRESALRPRAP